jgi:1,4-dihydroxy-2-naphthoyl-CoA hydrolase
MIDHKNIDIRQVNNNLNGSLSETLGMVVTELGADSVKMSMPVKSDSTNVVQSFNAGANLALAQSVASVAADLYVGNDQKCVGLDLFANQIREVHDGSLHATTKPTHIGKTTQVWETNICNDSGDLICFSRLTFMVVDK